MCWDYSTCGKCGTETPCKWSCGCDDEYECYMQGHRDCKEHYKCKTCCEDICEDCFEACGYRYCIDCQKRLDKLEQLNK